MALTVCECEEKPSERDVTRAGTKSRIFSQPVTGGGVLTYSRNALCMDRYLFRVR